MKTSFFKEKWEQPNFISEWNNVENIFPKNHTIHWKKRGIALYTSSESSLDSL